jgi:glutamate N-acetyltransferase/amino-acid N-acetyltransferase
MQPYVYPDLGIAIAPGSGPNTSDDIVSFKLANTHASVAVANDLRYQPTGLRTCASALGIKPDGRPDFTVMTLPQAGPAAAVFSQSRCPSDTTLRGRQCLADGQLQAVAVGSGNANIFTPNGASDVNCIATLLAHEFGIEAPQILLSLTGVIGVPLPMACFETGIPHLATTLEEQNLDAASRAILTSDAGPKIGSVALGDVVLAGIAKGAGMVEPNMATILVYLFTNAQLDHAMLQEMLVHAVNASFNRISIDAETSPGDTVALLSTATVPLSREQTVHFRQALTALCVKLARDIVSQGEGATTCIEATVNSPWGLAHANHLAKQVINSPLLKSAVYGASLNWGSIVAAIGKPVSERHDPILDRSQVIIRLQGHDVFRCGQAIEVTAQALLEALRSDTTVQIEVTIGAGGFLGRAWGCDLSPAYISLNAGKEA